MVGRKRNNILTNYIYLLAEKKIMVKKVKQRKILSQILVRLVEVLKKQVGSQNAGMKEITLILPWGNNIS